MDNYQILNGYKTKKGSYLWGGALTLAWKQLCNQIIKQPIKVKSNDQHIQRVVDRFNKIPFTKLMLSPECYYARSGYGPQTVNLINQQVSKKFPEKTTPALDPSLGSDQIVSFAYFFKNMQFPVQFTKANVTFKNKIVPGFQATKNIFQKMQIIVHKYENSQNFTIQLKTKNKNDHIFILKKSVQATPQQIIQQVGKINKNSPKNDIQYQSEFRMPIVSLSLQRTFHQLAGLPLENQKFRNLSLSKVLQIIKLDINQKGVRVQNHGEMTTKGGGTIKVQPRLYILDKPFWIVMRQDYHFPYLVAHINQVNDLHH